MTQIPPLEVTQSSFCELGNPAWQSESPERLRRGIQVLRWEKQQGRWSLRKVRVTRELSVWGGQGAWGPPQLDSGPLSLQPLCGPARVFYSSRWGDKSICGLALFCGKNDPMLVNPPPVLRSVHIFSQITCRYKHQFACQASKMGFSIIDGCWVQRGARFVCLRDHVTHLSRWVFQNADFL